MAEEAVFEVEIEGVGARFSCEADDTVLSAALRAGLGFPHECTSGACGTCRFQVLAGRFAAAWADAPGLAQRDRDKGDRLLGCQAHALGPGRIKVRLDPAAAPAVAPRRRTVRFLRARAITPTMSEFAFASEGAADFIPGQFARIRLPEVAGARAYSMSNLPNPGGDWRFIIKRVRGGAASRHLFEDLAGGAVLQLDAPYGRAHLRQPEGRPVVCIAGGSGLSPIISIIRGILAATSPPTRPVQLFYGGRDPGEVPDLALFPELAAAIPTHLEIKAAVSDAAVSPGDWSGPRGPVHELAFGQTGATLIDSEIYLAGPPAMVRASLAMLDDCGVERTRVHYDSFY
jgi:toluene monooxygenase electron transfer component